jgi:S-adenosylmethionine:tRNA ribosyltransferase-isomerase
LWIAAFDGDPGIEAYLEAHGEPIRYGPGPRLPMEAYQTVFATEPGSAEMPSAGRPFTTGRVTSLVSRGIVVAPIVLHAGVSSYEDDEPPGEERYEVPAVTAALVNTLRSEGGRIIAVGTTVVRALETVADDHGVVHPGSGLTDLVIGPGRPVGSVDGMITGWHEPKSSHLELLEALVPRPQLKDVYDEAISGGYQWHEFGDLLLIAP